VLKGNKMQSLKEGALKANESIKSLQEASRSLEQTIHAKEEQIQRLETATEDIEREHIQQLEESKRSYDLLLSLKEVEVKSSQDDLRNYKQEVEMSMKELIAKNLSWEQGNVQQLAASNALCEQAQEKVELYKKESISKDAAIEELTSNNKDQCNQINENRKAIKTMESNQGEMIKLHIKDTAAQKTAADKTKKKIEELAEDSKCRNAMQERITFLEKKLLQAQACPSQQKENNESSTIAAPEKWLSSNGEDKVRTANVTVKNGTTTHTDGRAQSSDTKAIKSSITFTSSEMSAGICRSAPLSNSSSKDGSYIHSHNSSLSQNCSSHITSSTAAEQGLSNGHYKVDASVTTTDAKLKDTATAATMNTKPDPSGHDNNLNASKTTTLQAKASKGYKESTVSTSNALLNDSSHAHRDKSFSYPMSSELSNEHFDRNMSSFLGSDQKQDTECDLDEDHMTNNSLSPQVSFDAHTDITHSDSDQKKGADFCGLTMDELPVAKLTIAHAAKPHNQSSRRLRGRRSLGCTAGHHGGEVASNRGRKRANSEVHTAQKLLGLHHPPTEHTETTMAKKSKDQDHHKPRRQTRGRLAEEENERKKSDKVKVKVGDVGYKFKKHFGSPYNEWYDGEVIEKLPGKSCSRRCRYTDGDVEDYSLVNMKDLHKFKPRS